MDEIFERLTIAQTERILELISSDFKEISNRIYVITLNSCKVIVFSQAESLQLHASFTGNYSMNRANEWNETKKYTRSYVKQDGSIVLEADYSLEGGVTMKSIAKFFGLYKGSLDIFVKEVL
jgi:hypothetical protein